MNRRHFLGALSWPAAAAATGGFVAARNANALEQIREMKLIDAMNTYRMCIQYLL